MKKIYYLLFAVVFCSCSNDDEQMKVLNPTEEYDMSFENPFDCVGYIHNMAMDSIKAQNIKDREIEAFTTAFVSNHESQVFNIGSSVNDETSKMMSKARKISTMYKEVSTTRAAYEINDSVLNTVPANLRNYVSTMFEMMDENYNDTIEINKDFAKLDYVIYNNYSLTNEEKGALLGISAIAKATLKYNLNDIRTRGVSVRSTAKADVGGAICGVFSFAFWGKAATGLVFGPGGVVLSCARELAIGAIVSSGVHVASGGTF